MKGLTKLTFKHLLAFYTMSVYSYVLTEKKCWTSNVVKTGHIINSLKTFRAGIFQKVFN